MESAELKKPKRIKHCYKRSELYHRFIHSEEYAYSPTGTHQLSCRENYLITGDIGYKSIDDYWFSISSRLVAIIDRGNKRILINNNQQNYIWELRRAIPDNYEIYFTIEKSLDKDIIKSKEQCLKLHSAYLIYNLTNNLSSFYRVVDNSSKVLHINISEIPSLWCTKEIIDFVKKNKLKKCDFYNKVLIDNIKVKYYKGYYVNEIDVCPPTLKQVITNTIFDKVDRLKLEQVYFHTNYCRGYGIPFKDVVTYWNKTDWSRTLANKYNRSNVCVELLNNLDTTWNEYISKSSEAIINIFKNKEKEYMMKSEENRQKALQELTKDRKDSDVVNNWRERKHSCYDTVCGTYSCYFPSRRSTKLGVWKTQRICSSFRFNNIQLRLSSTTYGTAIQTSNHATVQLADTIKCWDLFLKLKQKHENSNNSTEDVIYKLENKNIKIGIYNLRSIKYCTKVTDNNKSLNYKDWVIIIGCHHLWFEEIIDFIKYYHLEKEFNL